MKYYYLNKKYTSKDLFIRIEEYAFEKARGYKYVLFYVKYSNCMAQNIYLNLN